MRTFAVVVAVLLAGCSGGGSPSPADGASTADTESPASDLNATFASEPQNITTDTLFLLAAPFLNTSLPGNETVIAVKGPYTTQTFAWNRTANSTGNITGGRLVLWMLLPHSATQIGVGSDVGCTLAWTIVITNATAQRAADGGCSSLGLATIPPGEYRFNITLPPLASPLEIDVGANVQLQVTVGLVQPDGAAAYFLGGTAHRDSSLWLTGLAEPVDPPAAPADPSPT